MMSILYVDPNTEMCSRVRHMFEETGSISVYLAGSGEEAVTLSCHNRFDAIISDYHLPGLLKHMADEVAHLSIRIDIQDVRHTVPPVWISSD